MEKSFNGIGSLSQQQPISDVVEPSLPYISFPQKTNFRDASYESNQVVEDSEISIFDAQKYFNESNNDVKVSKGVSHQKHISERCNLSTVPPRFSSASSADGGYGRNYRAHSFHATPTASSEASWNSQKGLLSNPPGAIAVSMRNPTANTDEKLRRYTTKWLLGQKCPCWSKKSVQVEEKLPQPKTPSRSNTNSNATFNNYNHEKQTSKSVEIGTGGRRHEVINPNPNPHTRISVENRSSSLVGRPFSEAAGFTFPILNQSSPMKLVLNAIPSTSTLEDPPRDSLEVFIPSNDPVVRKAVELQHHQRMLVPSQSFTFLGSPKSRMPITDDDVASDTSSDLFEIESFSTQTTTYPMYHRRDLLDEASSFNARRLAATNGGLYVRGSFDEAMTPSIAPTECYEPSEASIDWSVTTAEGFDRASVTNFSVTASEVEDMTLVRYESEQYGTAGGKGGGRGSSKKKGSGLLSCQCEKAVSVGPYPVKIMSRVGPPIPATTTLRHVSSRPPNVNKASLARSHSTRLSLPFAT